MRKIVLSLMLLTLAINLIPLSASAADVQNIAMEVPTAITIENRNGMQIIIKSYAVSSKIDPVVKIDEPFYQNGYRYTYLNMLKEAAAESGLFCKIA